MFRTAATFAVLALLFLPDGASAFWWRYRAFRSWAYCPPPPVVVVPQCAPVVPVVNPGVHAPGSPLPPPSVSVEPPKGNTQAPDSQVRPTGLDEPGRLATPTPAPPEPAKTEARTPAVAETPPPPRPAEEQPESKLPKLDLPLTNPKSEEKATDPLKIELPPVPAGKKAEPKLPPLVVPQLPPPAAASESKYRPATADRPGYTVLPVDGAGSTGTKGTWKVGFYNYTTRDLELAVEGRTVALPARSYVTAAVPGTFSWRVGAGADESTTIPAGSGGVEVVLK
jgi:hypothetical protein